MAMRAAILGLTLACTACGPAPDRGCKDDGECGGSLVCARDGNCASASDVRVVRVEWTIRGGMANATSCGGSPDLYVMFLGFEPGDSFGFEPVPCLAGVFTIDKLPRRYSSVEIGDNDRIRQEKVITAQGVVTFDLAP
jgi:hypothetical protein